LVDAILASKCHIIATLRSKAEYVQTEENGKKEVKKVGTAPQQRDGLDYEFTVVFDLNQSHFANATKDRTSLFDGQPAKLSEDTGTKLKVWLDGGVPDNRPQPQSAPVKDEPAGYSEEEQAERKETVKAINAKVKEIGLTARGFAAFKEENDFTSYADVQTLTLKTLLCKVLEMSEDKVAELNGRLV
jgi:hypothetical protein